MKLRFSRSFARIDRSCMRPILEALEDRVVLDVGDTLMTAFQTNLGPGSGLFRQAREPVGDGPFGARDVDMYAFQARRGARLEAQTFQPQGGQSMDTILRLFTANGQELASNDDCVGLYSCINFTFTADGTYYMGVSGYPNFGYNPNQGGSGSDGSQGDYGLDLRMRAAVGPVLEQFTPGRSAGPLSSVRVRFDRAINPNSFTTADINGFSGPIGPIAVQSVTPVPGSNQEFNINFPMQVITGYYDIDIGPNILDTTGAAMDQDEDGVAGQFEDRFIGTFGIGGPKVNSISPGEYGYSSVARIQIVFDRAMDPATVTPEVLSLFGPAGAVSIAAVVPTDGTNRNFDVVLESTQTAVGNYTFGIFAGVRDTFGNPLDQNGNYIAGEPADDVSNPFFLLPSGCLGREGFGYFGCVSTWEDLNLEMGQPGVFVIIPEADDAAAPVNLGQNTFSFYGSNFTGNNQLFVSSNGLITFGAGNTAFTNTDMTTIPSERAIAPLWDDWIKEGAGDMVLGRIDGNRLIIEWNDVRHYPGSSSGVTFQAILQLNTGGAPGDIRFNYIDLNAGDPDFNNGASATVGIKDLGNQGLRRLVLNFNNAQVYDYLQLQFTTAGAAPSAPGAGEGATIATLLTRQAPANVVVPVLADTPVKGERNVAAAPIEGVVLETDLGEVLPTGVDPIAADTLFALDWAGF